MTAGITLQKRSEIDHQRFTLACIRLKIEIEIKFNQKKDNHY